MTELEKNYLNAKNDVLKALNSIDKLEMWQKEQLFKELMGIDAIVALNNMMRQHF